MVVRGDTTRGDTNALVPEANKAKTHAVLFLLVDMVDDRRLVIDRSIDRRQQ